VATLARLREPRQERSQPIVEPFDADAVVWNTARYKDIKRSRHVAEGKPISRLVVVDPHTVRIEMDQPDAPMLAVLSNWYGMMLAPKASEAAGKDIGAHPVCVGPYAFEREVAQDRIVLRRARPSGSSCTARSWKSTTATGRSCSSTTTRGSG
jgi:ABC-type transport system substrate-binding protein